MNINLCAENIYLYTYVLKHNAALLKVIISIIKIYIYRLKPNITIDFS